MIGEKFSDSKGKITSNRVIVNDKNETVVETSFQAVGKILGTECNELGTYVATMRTNGTLYAEGNGLLITKDGESICWKGHGIGKPTGKGLASSWRATIAYNTTSTKFAKLNTILGMVEHETDEHGNTSSTVSEWK